MLQTAEAKCGGMPLIDACKEIFRLKIPPSGLLGWSPRLRSQFGYYTPDEWYEAENLSVYQTSPKLWEREAFEEKLDGAPEATGEPGKFSAGELGRLTVRVFFSAGAGLLAWSHMPVETAQ